MTKLSIDTYQFVETLEQSGFSWEQSSALVKELQRIDLEHVATRQDIVKVRAEAADNKNELQMGIMKVREEIAGLKSDIFKWILPLLLGHTAATAGIIKLIIS